MTDFDELKESERITRFDFIIVELDLAIEFCETAVISPKTAKSRRIRHAKTAYAAADGPRGKSPERGLKLLSYYVSCVWAKAADR